MTRRTQIKRDRKQTVCQHVADFHCNELFPVSPAYSAYYKLPPETENIWCASMLQFSTAMNCSSSAPFITRSAGCNLCRHGCSRKKEGVGGKRKVAHEEYSRTQYMLRRTSTWFLPTTVTRVLLVNLCFMMMCYAAGELPWMHGVVDFG